LSEVSEPEPDLSVVVGDERTYLGTGHPTTALLVVEISLTSLEFDHRTKGSLYASAGIKDYWIVNLQGRCVEVYRSPVIDKTARFGHRYEEKSTFTGGQRIQPLALSADIAVADLLP
jgi:Uma2 family endonuclease